MEMAVCRVPEPRLSTAPSVTAREPSASWGTWASPSGNAATPRARYSWVPNPEGLRVHGSRQAHFVLVLSLFLLRSHN